MIRAATEGVRSRLETARNWLAVDRRWAIAAIGLLALVNIWGDPGVNVAPIALAAVLVTIGVVLIRPEAPATRTEPRDPLVPGAPRPRRPPSYLFPSTFAATLLALGLALVLDTTTDLQMDPGRFLALALFVMGFGLLLGGWWGRARLLIPIGLLLIPVVLLSSLAQVDLSGRVGDFYEVTLTAEDLPTRYDLLAGAATLDLTEVHLDGVDRTVNVELGIGEIDVLLPQRFRTDVTADLGGGSIYVLGEQLDGTNLKLQHVGHNELRENGTLTLNISAGAGSVAVEQVWASSRKQKEEQLDQKRDPRDSREPRDRRDRNMSEPDRRRSDRERGDR